jgi:hypothetical protein
MSYIELPDGIPDFSQFVISLWFRVPQESIEALRAAIDSDDYSPAHLYGVLPLLTFGKIVKTKRIASHLIPAGASFLHYIQQWTTGALPGPCSWVDISGSPTTNPVQLQQYYFTGVENDQDPSYIGVDCTSDRNLLIVNIQMADYASLDGSFPHQIASDTPDKTDWSQPVFQYQPGGAPYCTNNPPVDGNGYVLPTRTWTRTTTYESAASVVMGCRPEIFSTLQTATGLSFPEETVGQEVTPDHWHHLLLSGDLGLRCTTSGTLAPAGDPVSPGTSSQAAKMWMAFDDNNLTRKQLSFFWPDDGEDNDVLTTNAYYVYKDVVFQPSALPANDLLGNTVTEVSLGHTAPTCDYVPEPVPAAGAVLGIPASAGYQNAIFPVELAELQFFTGVTLDTSIEENRRAFVSASSPPDPDHPETGGTPVDPNKKTSDADPQSGSIELLGQPPDILLHGSGDWIIGKNTGSLIDNPDYDPVLPESADNPIKIPDPEKQFEPTGQIVSYTPDPSLHGPQSPEPPPETGEMRRQRRMTALLAA